MSPSSESLDAAAMLCIAHLVDALPHLVGITDDSGRIVWMNQAGRAFIGVPPESELTVTDVFGAGIEMLYQQDIRPRLLRRQPWSGVLAVQRADGSTATVDAVVVTTPDPDGSIRWIAMLAVDVTEQRRREAELAHRASHDPLTGLPNRALLVDRLTVAMAVAERTETPVAVIALDLDGFKGVNDEHGHAAGDLLLQQVTARLETVVRPADTVARLGGDEFVVVVHPPEPTTAAVQVAERIREQLAEPHYVLRESTVRITASIGLTVVQPEEGIDAVALLAIADEGMYRAKRAGGNCIRLAGQSGDSHLHRLESIGRQLGFGLRNGQLSAMFDPVVEIGTGRVLSLVATPLWEHPNRGPLGPDAFIHDAEVTGHADRVRWAAARTAVSVAMESGIEVPVDIVLTTGQLRRADVVDRVRVFRRAGPALALRIEISEHDMAEIPAAALHAIEALAADDVGLVLADHGLGGVPLAVLAGLPVAAVKLAPGITASLPAGRDAVVLATRFAELRGVPCVATGVLRADERDLMAELGIDAVQGPVTGGPWTVAQLPEALATPPRP